MPPGVKRRTTGGRKLLPWEERQLYPVSRHRTHVSNDAETIGKKVERTDKGGSQQKPSSGRSRRLTLVCAAAGSSPSKAGWCIRWRGGWLSGRTRRRRRPCETWRIWRAES